MSKKSKTGREGNRPKKCKICKGFPSKEKPLTFWRKQWLCDFCLNGDDSDLTLENFIIHGNPLAFCDQSSLHVGAQQAYARRERQDN
jgi:hypothetical protein